MSEYEAQAKTFCEKMGVRVVCAWKDTQCPKWDCQSPASKGGCPRCGNWHGDRYRATIRRVSPNARPRSVSFDFWNSFQAMQDGKRPTPYDILACISSDAFCLDNFEDFCAEFGYDLDSRSAEALFHRVSKFAKRLQAFFSEEELELLGQMQ